MYINHRQVRRGINGLIRLLMFVLFIFIVYYIVRTGCRVANQDKLTLQTPVSNNTNINDEVIGRLSNPEFIKNSLEENCKDLIVRQGTIIYKDNIKSKTPMTSKTLNLNLEFNYGITYDISTVNIEDNGETVIVEISKQNLQLEYVELDTNTSSYRTTEKSLFAVNFDPYDVQEILKHARKETTEHIKSDEEIINKSFTSAKKYIENDIFKLSSTFDLGIKKVIFKEN